MPKLRTVPVASNSPRHGPDRCLDLPLDPEHCRPDRKADARRGAALFGTAWSEIQPWEVSHLWQWDLRFGWQAPLVVAKNSP